MWPDSPSVFKGFFFFFSSRRRHTRLQGDWSSDVCSSDLLGPLNEIILMAVAKDPQARFQSATAFRNALQNVVVKETDQAKTQVMTTKTTPQIGRASCRERV